jgi:hypothetical protein
MSRSLFVFTAADGVSGVVTHRVANPALLCASGDEFAAAPAVR